MKDKKTITEKAIQILKEEQEFFCCNAMLKAAGQTIYDVDKKIYLEKNFPEFVEMVTKVGKELVWDYLDAGMVYVFSNAWYFPDEPTYREMQDFRIKKLEEHLLTLK